MTAKMTPKPSPMAQMNPISGLLTLSLTRMAISIVGAVLLTGLLLGLSSCIRQSSTQSLLQNLTLYTAELDFRPVILSPSVWFSDQNQAAADNAWQVCNLTEAEAAANAEEAVVEEATAGSAVSEIPGEPPEDTPAAELSFAEQKQQAIDRLVQYPGAGAKLCQMIADEYDDPQETAPEDVVVLEGPNGPYLLAPARLTEAGIQSAKAQLQGINTWTVALTLKPGEAGIDTFNELALLCYRGGAEVGRADDAANRHECLSGQLAIVLNGYVESAPTVESPQFERDEINISGSFTQREAEELAQTLNAGGGSR